MSDDRDLDVQFQFRMNRDIHDKLRIISKKGERSMGAQIRWLIERQYAGIMRNERMEAERNANRLPL